MNQKVFFCILLLLLSGAWSLSAQCDGGRYENKIFTNVDVESNIVYGWNTLSNGNMDTMKMDIYTPAGDTVINRPVVILAHGGSFINGSKNLPDMVAFCNSLARRGYVAVSMGYRLESDFLALGGPDAEEVMVKAVMRAVQDGRAAVRYIRRSFVELGDPYGVDTSQIHIGGSSAGGILAMQLAFMDDESKLKADWKPYATELGGLEGDASGSPGFSSKISSIINMAGAVADTNYITPENLVPVFSSHSRDDNTVLWGFGYPLNTATLPSLYGSGSIAPRMESLCSVYWFEDVISGGHPPYTSGNAAFDKTDSIIGAFLYRQQDCYPGTTLQDQQADQQANCDFVSVPEIAGINWSIDLYPNPSNGQVNLQLSDIMENGLVEIYNSIGKMIYTERLNGQITEMNLSKLSKGMYIVRVSDKKGTKNSLSKKLILN